MSCRSDGIIVRRLLPGDENEALEAAMAFRSSQWTVGECSAFLLNRRNHLLVGWADGQLAGYLVGYELSRLDGARPMMCLYELEVLEPHRRRGVGRAIVEQLRAHCDENGFLKMWVLTDANNDPARRLYEACGAEIQCNEPVLYWWKF